MRIATRLMLGFGLLLALLAALGVLVAYDMEGMQADLANLSTRQIPTLTTHLFLARDFTIEISQGHFFLMSREPWRLADARSASLLIRAALVDMARAEPPGSDRSVVTILKQFGELDRDVTDCERVAATGNIRGALSEWDRRVSPRADAVGAALEQLRGQREEVIVASANGAIDHTRRLRVVSLTVVLLAFIVGLLAATLLSRSILIPIRSIVRAVVNIARGDLSARAVVSSDDELGLLAQNLNGMADRIHRTILELHSTQAALRERNDALGEAYTAVRTELELAARVQREILPRDLTPRGVSLAADMAAASDLGGDFYDLLPARDGSTLLQVVVGDVSGKGIAAALMMVFVVMTLRELCRRPGLPSEMLARLNWLMLNRFGAEGEMYVTCILGSLDYSTLRFTFAKAGHEEPIWYRSSTGRCESLQVGGLFVGLFRDGQYDDRSIQLEPGDRLVLYTDGIVEARSGDREQFGHDRLMKVVEQHGGGGAVEIMSAIQEAVGNWSGGLPPRDDMTLLVIEAPSASAP